MLNVVFFLVVAVVIQGLLLAGHYALYKSIIRFFLVENPHILWYLKVILGFLSISFLLSSLLSSRFYSWPVQIYYRLSSLWLGFLYFLLLASAVVWLLHLAEKHWSFTIDEKLFATVLFGLAIVIGFYGIANADDVQVTHLKIKLNNLPDTWKGRTAVWIGDLHLGQIRDQKFAQLVVKKVNSLHPDIVFVGGDLFDGMAADNDQLVAPFAKLDPSLGTFFITGNHEEFDGNEKYPATVERVNMQVLDNEKKEIDGLQLIGVDYRDTTDESSYQKILANLSLQKDQPSVLLKHSPSYAADSAAAGIDLQLSGHTHDGQVIPVMYLGNLIYSSYEFGLHQLGNMLIYTSSGTGTWGPPFRIGTTSEIVQITFE